MPIYTPSLLPNIASVNPAAFAQAAPQGLQVAPIDMGPVYQGVQQANQLQAQFQQQQYQQQQFQAQQEQQEFNNAQVMRKQKLEDLDRKNKITDAVTGINILPKDVDKLAELKRDHQVNEDALNGAQTIEQMNQYRNNVAKMLNDSRYKEMQRDRLFYENSSKHINDPKNKEFFGANADQYADDLISYGKFGENSAGVKINREDIAVNKYYDSSIKDAERDFDRRYKEAQIQNFSTDNDLQQRKFDYQQEQDIISNKQNALLNQQQLANDAEGRNIQWYNAKTSRMNASTTAYNSETNRLKQEAGDKAGGTDNGLSYSQEKGIINDDSNQILTSQELKMPNGVPVKNGANVKLKHKPNLNGTEQGFDAIVTDEATARKLSGYSDPWFFQSDDEFELLQTKQKGVNGAVQNEWVIPGGTFEMSGRAVDELNGLFDPVSQGAPSPRGGQTTKSTQATNNQPSKYTSSSVKNEFIGKDSINVGGTTIKNLGGGKYSIGDSPDTGTADQVARYLNMINK